VVGLSVLARGTMTERLEWAFNLYDINRDGLITREEMLNIISAIYELMGRFCEPSVYENTTRDHVEMVFQVRVMLHYIEMIFQVRVMLHHVEMVFQVRVMLHHVEMVFQIRACYIM
jgi:hypothetical protein